MVDHGRITRKASILCISPHGKVSPGSGDGGQPCGRCPGMANKRTGLQEGMRKVTGEWQVWRLLGMVFSVPGCFVPLSSHYPEITGQLTITKYCIIHYSTVTLLKVKAGYIIKAKLSISGINRLFQKTRPLGHSGITGTLPDLCTSVSALDSSSVSTVSYAWTLT